MPTKLIKSDKTNKLRKIVGHVANNGSVSVSAGAGFSLTRNGVGDVTITLSKKCKKFLCAVITPIQTTAATAHMAKIIAAPSVSAVRVGTYVADATDGAPADIDFCFEITVTDTLY